MQPASYSHTAGIFSLMNYILYQALSDLKSNDKKTKDDAIEYLKSEDCEMLCEVINFDYQMIKEIDFDNPKLNI